MSTDALKLQFKQGETLNTVSRGTLKKLASHLGFNETQTVQYALARLREEVIPAYAPDAPDLSAQALQFVRESVSQDDYVPTRSLLDGL